MPSEARLKNFLIKKNKHTFYFNNHCQIFSLCLNFSLCHRKIFSLCLKIFPCVKAKFPVFSLSGKSKNQIPCFPCAVATLTLINIFCTAHQRTCGKVIFPIVSDRQSAIMSILRLPGPLQVPCLAPWTCLIWTPSRYVLIYYLQPTKLPEANVFICLLTRGRVSLVPISLPWGMGQRNSRTPSSLRNYMSRWYDVCVLLERFLVYYLDCTVGKRVVGILLKCLCVNN